jgi:hypothetical protein
MPCSVRPTWRKSGKSLCSKVGGFEVFGDLGGHHLVALLQNQFAVHVGGVVDAVFDQVSLSESCFLSKLGLVGAFG